MDESMRLSDEIKQQDQAMISSWRSKWQDLKVWDQMMVSRYEIKQWYWGMRLGDGIEVQDWVMVSRYKIKKRDEAMVLRYKIERWDRVMRSSNAIEWQDQAMRSSNKNGYEIEQWKWAITLIKQWNRSKRGMQHYQKNKVDGKTIGRWWCHTKSQQPKMLHM